MPGATPDHQIPYPLPGEAPDGSAQMQALATKVDDLFTDVYGKVPTSKVLWGRTSVDFDNQGIGRITHNAGWTPSVVILTGTAGGASPIALAQKVGGSYDASASTFHVLANYLNGTPFTGQITVMWIIRD